MQWTLQGYWPKMTKESDFPVKSTTTCAMCGELLFNHRYAYCGTDINNIYAITCDKEDCKTWLVHKVKLDIQAKKVADFQDSEFDYQIGRR